MVEARRGALRSSLAAHDADRGGVARTRGEGGAPLPKARRNRAATENRCNGKYLARSTTTTRRSSTLACAPEWTKGREARVWDAADSRAPAEPLEFFPRKRLSGSAARFAKMPATAMRGTGA